MDKDEIEEIIKMFVDRYSGTSLGGKFKVNGELWTWSIIKYEKNESGEWK